MKLEFLSQKLILHKYHEIPYIYIFIYILLNLMLLNPTLSYFVHRVLQGKVIVTFSKQFTDKKSSTSYRIQICILLSQLYTFTCTSVFFLQNFNQFQFLSFVQLACITRPGINCNAALDRFLSSVKCLVLKTVKDSSPF